MMTKFYSIAGIALLGALVGYGCGSSDGTGDGTGGTSGGDGDGSGGTGDGAGGSGDGTGGSGDGTGGAGAGTGGGGGVGGDSGEDGSGTSANWTPSEIPYTYDPTLDEKPKTCVSESIEAEEIPLDVFIMLDRSGSMEWLVTSSDVPGADTCAVGSSIDARWCNAINAIDGFVRDPSSVGMGISLGTFSGSGSGPGSGCGAQTSMEVGLDVVQAGDGNGQMQAITDELNAKNPGGGTATERAINTLIQFTGDRKAELEMLGEERTVIGIVVTDGEPTSCETNTTTLNGLVTTHYDGGNGIPTFFIGMTGLDTTQLEEMAVDGGAEVHTDYCDGPASCSYYSVGTGDSAVFNAALDAIREQVAGCDFAIPAGSGSVNVDAVDVTLTPGSGAAETLNRVADLAACSTNADYYVTGVGSDAIISLCPMTCERNDGDSKVDIVIPCEGQ